MKFITATRGPIFRIGIMALIVGSVLVTTVSGGEAVGAVARHVGNARTPVLIKDGAARLLALHTTGKNMSWSDLTRIYRVVSTARAATQKYGDLQAALKDGYHLDSTATGTWTHNGVYRQYLNRHRMRFNPAAPTGLVYMKMGSALMLSGVTFQMPAGSGVRALDAMLPGSVAEWQQRMDVCTPAHGLSPLAAAGIHDSSRCSARGGRFSARAPWETRAWIWLPGSGVFESHPDPMSGMNMRPPQTAPRASMPMTQGPYQMEMLPTNGKAPTWAELSRVYRLMSGAKKALDPFRDVKTATKAGYITSKVLYVPGQGAHYINPYSLFGPFNFKKPAVLVYNPVRGKEQLSSALYLMPETSTPAQLAKVFPASMAVWHRHINNCFTEQQVLPIHDRTSCLANANAHWLASTPWMVHAWLWEKKSGLFDMDQNA